MCGANPNKTIGDAAKGGLHAQRDRSPQGRDWGCLSGRRPCGQGFPERARQTWKALMASAFSTVPSDALLEQAGVHCRAGRLKEAEALYRQVLTSQPDRADVHAGLGL